MKRKELIRHLERHGCALLKEGAKHTRYINLANTSRVTTLPRHNEIADLLAIKICRQLENRKFRRQHSVGPYVLDFYCPSENICIELDGEGHYNKASFKYDSARTEYLNSFKIRVLRFENKSIFENAEGVLEEIRRNFNKFYTLWSLPQDPNFCHSGLSGIFQEAFQKDSRRALFAGMTLKINIQIIDALRSLPQGSSLRQTTPNPSFSPRRIRLSAETKEGSLRQ